jgi:ketosteroid isomerase-like protein
MYRSLLTAALLACIPCTLPAQAPAATPTTAQAVPSVELPAELARVLTDYETLYRTGGMKLAELFTDDGFVLSGGRPPIRGRPGIAEYYGRPGGPLSLRALAYATEGNVGYIIGGYTDQKGNPDIGKFTLTLRKGGDGRWMIVSDMDNGNAPPRRPSQ